MCGWRSRRSYFAKKNSLRNGDRRNRIQKDMMYISPTMSHMWGKDEQYFTKKKIIRSNIIILFPIMLKQTS